MEYQSPLIWYPGRTKGSRVLLARDPGPICRRRRISELFDLYGRTGKIKPGEAYLQHPLSYQPLHTIPGNPLIKKSMVEGRGYCVMGHASYMERAEMLHVCP